MPRKKEQPEEKRPIEMTSEELLDYAIAPEVSKRLRELVRKSDDDRKAVHSEKDK